MSDGIIERTADGRATAGVNGSADGARAGWTTVSLVPDLNRPSHLRGDVTGPGDVQIGTFVLDAPINGVPRVDVVVPRPEAADWRAAAEGLLQMAPQWLIGRNVFDSERNRIGADTTVVARVVVQQSDRAEPLPLRAADIGAEALASHLDAAS